MCFKFRLHLNHDIKTSFHSICLSACLTTEILSSISPFLFLLHNFSFIHSFLYYLLQFTFSLALSLYLSASFSCFFIYFLPPPPAIPNMPPPPTPPPSNKLSYLNPDRIAGPVGLVQTTKHSRPFVRSKAAILVDSGRMFREPQ